MTLLWCVCVPVFVCVRVFVCVCVCVWGVCGYMLKWSRGVCGGSGYLLAIERLAVVCVCVCVGICVFDMPISV